VPLDIDATQMTFTATQHKHHPTLMLLNLSFHATKNHKKVMPLDSNATYH